MRHPRPFGLRRPGAIARRAHDVHVLRPLDTGSRLAERTTNFKEGTAYRGANADRLRLVERFTPVSADTLEWAVTIDDPTTWTEPWTFAMHLTRGGAEVQPFEYACHEGNYGLENMLRAARAEEQGP